MILGCSFKEILVGKGDTRTRRGKIARGTFGKTRRRKKNRNGDKRE